MKKEVFYPIADGNPFTEEHIALFHRFEPIIFRHAIALLNCQYYLWERDPAVKSTVYVRLLTKRDRREVLSQALHALNGCIFDDTGNCPEFEGWLLEGGNKLDRQDQKKSDGTVTDDGTEGE